MQIMQYEKTKAGTTPLTGLDEIEAVGSYSIFIRHGDRDKIPEGEFGNEVELNDLGFHRSFEYGTFLKQFKIKKIYSSPIIRCVQTAKTIRKGYGENVPIELTTLLGDPGAFVTEGELAGKMFMKMGFNYCYESLLNHDYLEGNRDISEGSAILSDFFQRNSVKNGVNIYVSHYMIVALYSYDTFGKKYTLGDNWVKYLGGLIIKHE